MTKNKKRKVKALGFDSGVLSQEQAQQMHSDMAEVVNTELQRLLGEQRAGEEIDLDKMKALQTWMRDNKIVPLSKQEQREILQSEHEQDLEAELLAIREAQATKFLARDGNKAVSAKNEKVFADTLVDARLESLHRKIQKADDPETKELQEWERAKQKRTEIRQAAMQEGFEDALEYVMQLPPMVRVDAVEALELYDDLKDKYKGK